MLIIDWRTLFFTEGEYKPDPIADAADRSGLQFPWTGRRIEGARIERFRARHGLAGVIKIGRNGADARPHGASGQSYLARNC